MKRNPFTSPSNRHATPNKIRKRAPSSSPASSTASPVTPDQPQFDFSEGFEDFADDAIPSDCQIMIELLQSHFPKPSPKSAQIMQSLPRIILQSQLYSFYSNHNSIDSDLESLKRSGKIRIFHIPNTLDEYAILPMSDYISQIETISRQYIESSRLDVVDTLRYFQDLIIKSEKGYDISMQRLNELLQKSCGDVTNDQIEDRIKWLLEAGLLVREEADRFRFHIPNSGVFFKQCRKGRAEILQYLGKLKFKECSEKKLMELRLRSSVLGMRFHIRDLVGAGLVVRVAEPKGDFIRFL
eukprot:TRINITY_DN10213_c0_g1_i1.p1 TRINITY_DN10213_c0_g1~~TRINITY_DN10213_c0_g1_i1.p1  ORF type:complete len:297 (-),score=61.35 TRINITY_DN10213_c0_g1_i1:63-953(-)